MIKKLTNINSSTYSYFQFKVKNIILYLKDKYQNTIFKIPKHFDYEKTHNMH